MRRDVIGALCVSVLVLGIGFIGAGLLQHYVILAKMDHLATYLVAFGSFAGLVGLVGLIVLLSTTSRTRP